MRAPRYDAQESTRSARCEPLLAIYTKMAFPYEDALSKSVFCGFDAANPYKKIKINL
jgi:hypothetical protein